MTTITQSPRKLLSAEGRALRDKFAIEAMKVMLSDIDRWGKDATLTVGEKISVSAYYMADTMLAERAK